MANRYTTDNNGASIRTAIHDNGYMTSLLMKQEIQSMLKDQQNL
jgi:hypothetical protein